MLKCIFPMLFFMVSCQQKNESYGSNCRHMASTEESCVKMIAKTSNGLLPLKKLHEEHSADVVVEVQENGIFRQATGQISKIHMEGEDFFLLVEENQAPKLFPIHATNIKVQHIGESHVMDKKTRYQRWRSLQDSLCSEFKSRKRHPMYGKMKGYLDSKPELKNMDKLRSLFDRRCSSSWISGMVSGGGYLTTSLLREFGHRNAITEHYSNFAVGFTSMAILDQCLKSKFPNKRNEILAITLGVNSIANVYFELDLPGNWQFDPDPTVTDPGDLVAGGSATLLYLVVAKLLEQTHKFKMAEVCL